MRKPMAMIPFSLSHLAQKTLTTLGVAVVVMTLGLTPSMAETFPLPAHGDDIIGELRHTHPHQEDTLIDIARRLSVGQDEMMMANPTVDRWLPGKDADVIIPQEYILPNAPRAGIVVNIPEMRLYYFPVRPVAPARKVASAKKGAVTCSMVPVESSPAAAKSGRKSADAGVKPKADTTKPSPAQKSKVKPPATPTKSMGAAPASNKAQATNKPGAAAPAKTAKPTSPAKLQKVCKPQVEPQPVEADQGGSFESANSGEVITYPVSMGRMDWRTPIGKTTVVHKQKDPSWTPPASIKREHAAKGDPLPDVVPPGPDNPLGKYAMRLGVAGYLIHGTDAAKADGIGMRVTHGCMRLYNEDIAKLFPLIPVGSPVYLVNQPVKLGWKDGLLYMEVSQPLDEDVGIAPHDVDENVPKRILDQEDAQRARFLMRLANQEIQRQRDKGDVMIDMDKVHRAIEKPTGIPVRIGGTSEGWDSGPGADIGLAPPPKSEAPDSLTEKAAKPGGARAGKPPALEDQDDAPVVTPRRPIAPLPRSFDGDPEGEGGTQGGGYSPENPYRPEAEPARAPAIRAPLPPQSPAQPDNYEDPEEEG